MNSKPLKTIKMTPKHENLLITDKDIGIYMIRACLGGHLGKSGNFQTAKAHGNVLNELSTIENIDIGIIWSEGGIWRPF